MAFLFNKRGVSHLSFGIGASDTEIRIPWEDFNQFTRSNARDGDTMMAILRDPENREIIEIDLFNIFSGPTDKYLVVNRAQGGTSSQAWPAGTLLFISTHADHYEACFQPDSTRQIDFNPNGVLSPNYQGEKILQYTGCQIRWWMSFNAVDPYWHLIAGEPCEGEEFIDPGFGFRVWFKTVIECLEQHFDNTKWQPRGSWPGSWDGTKWLAAAPGYFDLEAIGPWKTGYRPTLVKMKVQNFCNRGVFRLYDTGNNIIAENLPGPYSVINLGPEGDLWHIDWSNNLDIDRLYMQGVFSDPQAATNIEFFTDECTSVTANINGAGGDGHVGSPETFSWPAARDATSGTVVSSSAKPFVLAHRWSPYYRVYRAFLEFDLSGIVLADPILWEVELFYYGQFTTSGYLHDSCVQESGFVQPLALTDFDNFTGPLLNRAPEAMIQGSRSLWFNQAGRDYVESMLGLGPVKFCVRDYTYDYNNIAPTHGPWFHSMNHFELGFGAELRIYGDW